jgi:hypothetical protein
LAGASAFTLLGMLLERFGIKPPSDRQLGA